MRQVIQSYRSGVVELMDVPAPRCGSGAVLVRNRASLISLGTERSTIELGRKSLLGKARARPDLVRRVIEKAKRDGLVRTYAEAMGRLDTPTPLGYSAAGEVVEAGVAATAFKPGDRVACIGQGFASHAEFVAVPANLVARIPEGVNYEEAAFGMLGVIALHGVRSAKLEFGARVVVLGLGLLGLLTVQVLKAYGCRVACMDISDGKVALARTLGADVAVASEEELDAAIDRFSDGFGADAVIVTASAKSAGPIHAAVKLSRRRGRVVVVGVADIHPDRNELWAKEVELVVSRAGGPGSLDPIYEQQGVDLPIGDVRWTENRNLEEFLRLIAEKRLNVEPLITHRFAFDKAERAYADLIGGGAHGAIGILLEYPADALLARAVESRPVSARRSDRVALGVIGAGLFGRSVLLPALAKVKGAEPALIVASGGASAGHTARRFGFARSATEASEAFDDAQLGALVVATPHSQHAAAVLKAIETGKALFIEKPLCVMPDELRAIESAAAAAETVPPIMVGHNRRYSPHMRKVRSWIAGRQSPLVLDLRINAGFVPADHWVHAEGEGRSRVIGEMTHFLDQICSVTGSSIRRVQAARVTGDGRTTISNDNISVVLELADGSVATLTYSAQGSRSTPREQLEIWSEGATITSANFTRSVITSATGRRTVFATRGAEAGYVEELQHFVDVARGAATLEPGLESALHVMAVAFGIETALATGKAVRI